MSTRVDTESLVRGLLPAFRDLRSGETHLARAESGELADRHEFHHLPTDWIETHDEDGRPLSLHASIALGYRRGTEFIRLDRHMLLPLDS